MASLRKNEKLMLVTKDQILEELNNFDGSIEDFKEEIEKRFGYIEVQLWNDECCKMGREEYYG